MLEYLNYNIKRVLIAISLSGLVYNFGNIRRPSILTSPIKGKINAVFIPVSDIKKAKEWYTHMLDIKDGEEYFDHLFVAKTEGADVILDTMPMWRDENGELQTLNVPAIMFGTDDIHASYHFMKDQGVELVSDIENDQFFVFKDPDGNKLMVCKD